MTELSMAQASRYVDGGAIANAVADLELLEPDGHTVYAATADEPEECHEECEGCAADRLRALITFVEHQFTKCPDCNGEGEGWVMDSLGNEHGPHTCGTCEGGGFVQDAPLRAGIEDVIRRAADAERAIASTFHRAPDLEHLRVPASDLRTLLAGA